MADKEEELKPDPAGLSRKGKEEEEEEEDEEEHGVQDLAKLSNAELRRLIRKRLSYRNQCCALFAKTAIAQKRNYGTNVCQCLTPILLIWIRSEVDLESSYDLPSPIIKPPFLLLSQPQDGEYRPPSAKILYSDDGVIGDVPIGQFDPYGGNGTGLLGKINSTVVPMKFVEYMASELYLRDLDLIRTVPENYSIDDGGTPDDIDDTLFAATGEPALYTSGYEFNEVSVTGSALNFSVYYNYTISRGRDIVSSMSFITQAFATFLPSPRIFFNFLGIKKMPLRKDDFDVDVAGLVGDLFFTLILHQLLPLFLSAIVYEKENRIREMMKMMGLRMPIYWLVQYFWSYMLYCCVALFLIICGWIFRFRWFTINNPLVYFVMFFIWGHTLVAMSFLLSVLFQRERTATTFGYIYILGVCLVGVFTIESLITNSSTAVLNGISVVPSFALIRAISFLSDAVSNNGPGVKISNIGDDPLYIWHVYVWHIGQWAVMLLLGLYLDQVFPGNYGLPKHPLFFLAPLKRLPGVKKMLAILCCRSNGFEENGDDLEGEGSQPPDVKQEAERAFTDDNLPLKVQALTKEYNVPFWDAPPFSIWRYIPMLWGKKPSKRKPERALKGASFVIDTNECVGFLGPNGAGKTTTMGIICGLITPSSGTVRVFGFSLPRDVAYIHLLTGVCPQHDIVWGNLTAKEHLQFYGRLKGMHGSKLKREVRKVLKSLNLYNVRHKLVRKFSGGMKRRLSVGMSLMGDPKIILLDEPSTGLDPKSKRGLWSAISARKKNASLILTTHSMEEAEALCNRIVIMADGRLRTVGTAAELKSRFGKGYKLTVTCADHGDKDQAIAFIKKLIPGAKEISNISGTVLFYLPKKSVVLSQVFSNIEANKSSLGITDWGISNTTLEEVFHQVVSNRMVPGAEADDENAGDGVNGEEEPVESGTSEEKPESEDSLDQEARSSSSEDDSD